MHMSILIHKIWREKWSHTILAFYSLLSMLYISVHISSMSNPTGILVTKRVGTGITIYILSFLHILPRIYIGLDATHLMTMNSLVPRWTIYYTSLVCAQFMWWVRVCVCACACACACVKKLDITQLWKPLEAKELNINRSTALPPLRLAKINCGCLWRTDSEVTNRHQFWIIKCLAIYI